MQLTTTTQKNKHMTIDPTFAGFVLFLFTVGALWLLYLTVALVSALRVLANSANRYLKAQMIDVRTIS